MNLIKFPTHKIKYTLFKYSRPAKVYNIFDKRIELDEKKQDTAMKLFLEQHTMVQKYVLRNTEEWLYI